MSALTPLDTVYEAAAGTPILLPPKLASVYGTFQLATHANRPHVIGNFVTTLDGVVALNAPGYMSGGAISGNNEHDRLVMGLLRAVSDAVVVGAGTLRSVPDHRWTASYIYPTLAADYQALRTSLNKSHPPLNVIVTARGEINPRLPVFQSQEAPVLIVTTTIGMQHIHERDFPAWVQVVQAATPLAGMETGTESGTEAGLSAQVILAAVQRVHPCKLILVEGGPNLMGGFFAERRLDELFLTLAPQVAGRDDFTERPGLVAGRSLAPEHPAWGTLVDVRRGGSHLFLRYAFEPFEAGTLTADTSA